MPKIRAGIIGTGFGSSFMKLLHMHPDVEKVVACDMNETRRKNNCDPLGIESYNTYDDMLAANPDLTVIGVFTERHSHGPLIIDALKKGMHVLSAVPIAVDIEDMREIIRLVEETRLICMIAETCYYFPDAIFCREEYKKGTFGDFVFGEAAYYHDISEFNSLAKDQRGIPPMFYSTHSMSMLFGAIADHPVDVCCFGAADPLHEHPTAGGIWGKGNNIWDNPFANETAIFHMSKGGIACINEYRRIGKSKPSSVLSILRGTKASYDSAGRVASLDFGELPHLDQKADFRYVSDEIATKYLLEDGGKSARLTSYAYSVGYSHNQNVARMPKAFRDLQNLRPLSTHLGHNGSHPLLVDDFVRAVMSGKLPPNNVWESATYAAPGVIAHESALAGGVTMKIPTFGEPPADWARLDYADRVYDDNE
ncbi:MAG: Gfo/Idh/MocA family oxidoreductase [Ruminococcaceae bacterium]|nr:Gfo/Idh/MocA family oxidoreductase [Oscillospiraceae bacterium]